MRSRHDTCVQVGWCRTIDFHYKPLLDAIFWLPKLCSRWRRFISSGRSVSLGMVYSSQDLVRDSNLCVTQIVSEACKYLAALLTMALPQLSACRKGRGVWDVTFLLAFPPQIGLPVGAWPGPDNSIIPSILPLTSVNVCVSRLGTCRGTLGRHMDVNPKA